MILKQKLIKPVNICVNDAVNKITLFDNRFILLHILIKLTFYFFIII